MELEKQYNKVIESIGLLAKPYDKQVKALPVFADVPDDIVAEFENSFLLLPQLIEANYFTMAAISSVIKLYNEVQWCIRNIGIEDLQTFKSHEKWNGIREHSSELLNSILKTN